MKIFTLLCFKRSQLQMFSWKPILFFFILSDCSFQTGDEKREGAVLGSLQAHFVSSIGGARQKEHRNQSSR